MKIIELRNHHMQIQVLKPPGGQETLSLQMADRATGDVIVINFDRATWEELGKQATGIVVANGQMAIPTEKPRFQ